MFMWIICVVLGCILFFITTGVYIWVKVFSQKISRSVFDENDCIIFAKDQWIENTKKGFIKYSCKKNKRAAFWECKDSKKAVILLHGLGEDPIDRASVSLEYYKKGYSVFIPYLKNFCFVKRESVDEWLFMLKKLISSDTTIRLHGYDLGAISMLQKLKKDPDAFSKKGFESFCIESPRYDFSKECKDRLQLMFGKSILQKPFVVGVFFGCSWACFLQKGFFIGKCTLKKI